MPWTISAGIHSTDCAGPVIRLFLVLGSGQRNREDAHRVLLGLCHSTGRDRSQRLSPFVCPWFRTRNARRNESFDIPQGSGWIIEGFRGGAFSSLRFTLPKHCGADRTLLSGRYCIDLVSVTARWIHRCRNSYRNIGYPGILQFGPCGGYRIFGLVKNSRINASKLGNPSSVVATGNFLVYRTGTVA